MNPNLKTALWGLAAATLVLAGINGKQEQWAKRSLAQSQPVEQAQPVVTTPPAPQPVSQSSEQWIVVLVSWENRAPIDHMFGSYNECHMYMVKIALPMIQDQPDVYAKCEKIG